MRLSRPTDCARAGAWQHDAKFARPPIALATVADAPRDSMFAPA